MAAVPAKASPEKPAAPSSQVFADSNKANAWNACPTSTWLSLAIPLSQS